MKRLNPKCKLGGELYTRFTLGLLTFTFFVCFIFYVISDTKTEEAGETAASSSGIAIFVDNGNGYTLSSKSTFPTSSLYTLNTLASYCSRGGTITQNSETKKISISLSSPQYCELFFDLDGTTLSDYVISLADTETTPDFSQVAETDEGVFAMEDDYGTSYYFRGTVENNYVVFGEATTFGYGLLQGGVSWIDYYETIDECNSVKAEYEEEFEEECICDDFQMLWRIVRVNGDGTVRLIYEGLIGTYSKVPVDGEFEEFISIDEFDISDAVGYMHGDPIDTKSSSTSSISMSSSSSYYYGSSYTYDASTGYYTLSGSTTSGVWSSIYSDVISIYKYTCRSTSSTDTCVILYEITEYNSDTSAMGYKHELANTYDTITKNKNNSTIKTRLDTWFEDTFLNSRDYSLYEAYLADAIFCNDRSLYSGDGYSSDTVYGANYRLSEEYGNYTPQLKCNQQNDAFTVDDTTYGNGDLTYPIGLITADEVALAGGVESWSNDTLFLYNDYSFWTMTPYSNSYIYISFVGGLEWYHSPADSGATTRPVINLKSDVLISSGTGTIDSPFYLELAS